MPNLFFVSVAIGIFSGTSLTSKAQTSINLMKVNDGTTTLAPKPTSAPHFIEGIEIKRSTYTVVVPTAVATAVPTRLVQPSAGISTAIEGASLLQFKYAQLIDTEVEAIGNFNLYNFIDEWWGTRYRYGGTTRVGVDCSAFTGELNRKVFGTNIPRTARGQYAACEKIKREDLKEGDLVFFNTRGGVSHVGVYLGNGHFVHASVGSGVTISSLDEAYYDKRYIGGGRMLAETATE